MARRLESSLLFQREISVPSKSTRPLSLAISRDRMPMTVDLPAPLGPIREMTFPFGIWKLTESTTAFPSYFFVNSFTCMAISFLQAFFAANSR